MVFNSHVTFPFLRVPTKIIKMQKIQKTTKIRVTSHPHDFQPDMTHPWWRRHASFDEKYSKNQKHWKKVIYQPKKKLKIFRNFRKEDTLFTKHDCSREKKKYFIFCSTSERNKFAVSFLSLVELFLDNLSANTIQLKIFCGVYLGRKHWHGKKWAKKCGKKCGKKINKISQKCGKMERFIYGNIYCSSNVITTCHNRR